MIGVNQGFARPGVDARRPPFQSFLDESSTESSVGAGNQNCLIPNVHSDPTSNFRTWPSCTVQLDIAP